jgi:hypothetical protein
MEVMTNISTSAILLNFIVAISRFIVEDTPAFISKTLRAMMPTFLYDGIYSCYDYAINKRNPLLQVRTIIIFQ